MDGVPRESAYNMELTEDNLLGEGSFGKVYKI